MNRTIIALSVALLVGLSAQQETPFTSKQLLSEVRRPNAGFDPEWAAELKADELGMKRYVMAFLKRGPKRDQSAEEAERLQRGHMDNIGKMAAEGKLIIAGPFLDTGDVRGIYVFNVETIEEAKALTETDPAIKAGRLEMELHPWYGSAALQLTAPLHSRAAKSNP